MLACCSTGSLFAHRPVPTTPHPARQPLPAASIFRTSLPALLAVNPGLEAGTYLQKGMRLRIPPYTAACGNGESAGRCVLHGDG